MRHIIIKGIIGLLLTGCITSGVSNKHIDQNKNLVFLCKVWGFLKYNSPTIGDSDINWDSVLFHHIDLITNCNNQDSISNIFESLVETWGIPSEKGPSIKCQNDSMVYANQDVLWINDSGIFSQKTINLLSELYFSNPNYDNKYVSSNQYVNNPIFDADTLYFSTEIPNTKIRLLALFRYWNIINYFYPYKYLIEDDWEDVLNEFIPIFRNSDDKLSYHLAVSRLTSKIKDCHAFTYSKFLESYYGQRFLPVQFELIEENTIVSNFYSDSLAYINGFHLGDIIMEINGQSVNFIRDSLSKYFSASNSIINNFNISYYLTRSSQVFLKLKIKRRDSVFHTSVPTYSRKIIAKERLKKKKHNPTRIIDSNITYIDLSQLDYTTVDSIISKYITSDVLIYDLRNNCKFILHDIAKYIFPKPVTFYSYTTPYYNQPGIFCFNVGEQTGPIKENINSYKGYIIILINEKTQSIGEFTAMLLAAYPKTLIIGRSTAGADGNVSTIYLPGRITTYISGIGIYWPNGEQTQRIGIIPDIFISKKIKSVVVKEDDVLNSAVEYAKRGLTY